jgi:FlaA1/EpsC-like NDP-sugar epimerase
MYKAEVNNPSGKYSLFFFKGNNPRWLILAIDVVICLFSVILAFLLRFNFNFTPEIYNKLGEVIILILGIRLLTFLISRAYTGIVRYTCMKDIFRILLINFIGSASLLILNPLAALYGLKYPVPFSIIGIDFLATVFFMIMYRLAVKAMYLEFSHGSVPKTRVIIYGSKEIAVYAKRALELDPKNHYKVVAFISTCPITTGNKLEGISVYPYEDLVNVIHKCNVEQLLFASSKLNVEIENSIVKLCLDHNVKVFNIPGVTNGITSSVNVKKIKEFRIEDLLSRETIVLNRTVIKDQLENKTILITGAAGSIGSEIVRQIMQFSFKRLILIDQAETPLFDLGIELGKKRITGAYELIVADITSKQKMDKIFSFYKPNIVYHAAAYKHVPMMENNPIEAISNNVLGTKNMADLSASYKVSKFIFISTDKAVNPTNVMGASKRIAEMYIQALNRHSSTSFITTRFGNVLGSNGSVIPLFSKQIEAGGPVTVTHPDVTRFFMTIPEASQLVLEAGAYGRGGEIFIFDMGKSIKILDLAKNMIKLAGLEPYQDIQIEFSGLRPGEKLYEELLYQSENAIATHHPKIMISKVQEYNFAEVSQRLSVLEQAIHTQNALLVVREMKKTVPEFISQNSAFEEIDKENNFINNRISSLRAV